MQKKDSWYDELYPSLVPQTALLLLCSICMEKKLLSGRGPLPLLVGCFGTWPETTKANFWYEWKIKFLWRYPPPALCTTRSKNRSSKEQNYKCILVAVHFANHPLNAQFGYSSVLNRFSSFHPVLGSLEFTIHAVRNGKPHKFHQSEKFFIFSNFGEQSAPG